MSKKYNSVEELDKARTRNFCALLYPDCDAHISAFNELMGNENYKVCGILHNRDTYEEDSETHKAGEPKKEHWHLIIELKDTKTRTALAKKLGINKEALEPCENLKASKRYLIHADNDDKALYELSEVFGNNADSVIKLVEGRENENISAKRIVEFIAEYDGYLSATVLGRFCYSNQLWSAYRRASYIFNEQRKEHNKKRNINEFCENEN